MSTTEKPSWQRSPASGSETPTEASDHPTGAMPAAGETPATETSDESSDLESLKAALKKARAEAATHRHKANELDTLKAQMEQEKLSEKERLEKQVAALQQQMAQRDIERQERLVNAELRAVAASLGWQHPEIASKLVERAELEFDEDGSPTNVESVLAAMAKKYPDLVGKGTGSLRTAGGSTNPSRSQTTGNKPIESWEQIAKLSQEEYMARRADIQAFMQQNHFRFGQQRH